ncbi:hypothetical protein Bca52824_071991 [Brassica carinata]|uniref:Uncharacterized protein n=1 Tax=Brassica carinata TaxID=52824 RepID=A0A8X7Q8M5_BRACI|nr:hypothetical protein Bca52824_071991 [Brassica carinata]
MRIVWEDMLRERWISWGWFHHFILRKNMIDGHCWRNWQESGIPVTEGYGFSLVSSNQLKTLFQYNQLDGKAFLLVIHFDGLGTRGKVWLRVQVHDLPNTSRLVYDGLFVEKGSNF